MTLTEDSYTLRYRSTRGEVWRWYWKRWRSSLWMMHALCAAVAALAMASSRAFGPSTTAGVAALIYGVVYFVIFTAISAAVPQVQFKSPERVLTLNADGWTTTIGGRSGSCPWSGVSAVTSDQDGGLIIQGRRGNALIVPARAFAAPIEKDRVVTAINRWMNSSPTRPR